VHDDELLETAVDIDRNSNNSLIAMEEELERERQLIRDKVDAKYPSMGAKVKDVASSGFASTEKTSYMEYPPL
jgi:hypothetical protein